MFTAEEYRTAAKILDIERPAGWVELVDDLMGMAAEASRRERYARTLGSVAWSKSGYGNLSIGLAVIERLLKDGWTPPEGLF